MIHQVQWTMDNDIHMFKLPRDLHISAENFLPSHTAGRYCSSDSKHWIQNSYAYWAGSILLALSVCYFLKTLPHHESSVQMDPHLPPCSKWVPTSPFLTGLSSHYFSPGRNDQDCGKQSKQNVSRPFDREGCFYVLFRNPGLHFFRLLYFFRH